ncbi:hypothetical protein HPP92_007636 [Vanilla planifolia]|uniref:Uncharacterized protein n=1 Tax=Vanilla planifolia TaxID=51239 RepID=A0A835RAU1_VANPL|nr:hypothetical protein HPP92_007636 [Vanilla planifolia]
MPNPHESTHVPPAAAGSSSSVAVKANVVIFCVNAVATTYNAWGDSQNMAFAVFAYAFLLGLLVCVRVLEKRGQAKEGAGSRGIKVAVWALATMLNAGFAWRAAKMLPFVFAAAAWALVAVFSLGSFWALLLYRPVGSTKEDGTHM